MFDNPRTIGIMFWIYVAAQIVNYWHLHYEDRNEKPTFSSILLLISVVLWILSLPIFLVMRALDYFYDARTEQQHRNELIKQSNEDFAHVKKHEIEPLKKEIRMLQSEITFASIDAQRKGYQKGSDEGYRVGFTDGFEECLGYTFYCDDEKESLRAKAREHIQSHTK